MRQLSYRVAASLDGFIAGPQGEYDWIVSDPSIDFTAIYQEFDTALMGRKTFELARGGPGLPGMQTIVCSRTLRAKDFPGVRIVADAVRAVRQLKAAAGRNIWLFGGGMLFRDLLDARLVDKIDVMVMPIMLSQGIPLLPAGERSPRLRLANSTAMPSGIVALNYTVENEETRRQTRKPSPRKNA